MRTGGDRFDEVLIESAAEHAARIVGSRKRGQRDHRNALRPFLLPRLNVAKQSKSILIGHGDVGHNHRRPASLDGRDGRSPRRRRRRGSRDRIRRTRASSIRLPARTARRAAEEDRAECPSSEMRSTTSSARRSMVMRTRLPGELNLMALVRRLIVTCRRRSASPFTWTETASRSGWTLRAFAAGVTDSIERRQIDHVARRVSLPVAMLVTSSSSSMMCACNRALLRIIAIP